MSFSHNHSIGSRIEITRNFNGINRAALIIDTNLELDPAGFGYSKENVDSLIHAADEYMRKQGGQFDSVVISGNRTP